MSYKCSSYVGNSSAKLVYGSPYFRADNSLRFHDYKSERLAQKEVKKIVTFLFSHHGINPAWVLDDTLWKSQVEYEELIIRWHNNIDFVCGCHDCYEGFTAELKAAHAGFPKNRFTKELVEPIFVGLCTIIANCRNHAMIVSLYTVLSRFVYGPGRVMLKSKEFHTVLRNLFYMDYVIDGLDELSVSEEKYKDAKNNLEILLNTNEDEDGYNIFHE